MGLITTEVEIGLNPQVINNLEKVGYILPRYKNKNGIYVVKRGTKVTIKPEELTDNSKVKVNTECDSCGKTSTINWSDYRRIVKDDGKTYCNKCAYSLYGNENRRISRIKTSKTFYQWCIDNNKKELLDRWDYDLNNYDPREISYCSSIPIWFKCKNGNHESELKSIASHTSGSGGTLECKKCNSFAQWGIDNLAKNFLEKYWDYNKNKLDPWSISYGCHDNIWLICQDCGTSIETIPHRFGRQGLSCGKCSDGLSYPNKLMYSILDSLGVIFETEKHFKWCKFNYKNKVRTGRYDFYFVKNNKKYLIEMDGGWHYKDNNMSGMSKEDAKYIDNEKDILAKYHNLVVIRIDCYPSEFDYIRNNILNSELSSLFNFDNFNWISCEDFAHKSFINIICELWNKGLSTRGIKQQSKLSYTTINKYLIIGNRLDLCDYTPELGKKRGDELARKMTSKKVICLNDNIVYDSITEAATKLNLNHTTISRACQGKSKKINRNHWMYYEDYLNSVA